MQNHLLGTFQIQQLVVLRDDASVSFYHGGTNSGALFHNSGFSNWYPFIFNEASPGQFFVAHEQQTIRVNHAEDIVYWTDGTYTISEVHSMEARLLYGLEISQLDSPLDYFAHVSCGAGLPDETVSLAAELLILCTRE